MTIINAPKAGQGQVMLPGQIFDRLKIIPAQLTFGIRVAAFDEVALGFAPGHRLQGGRRVAIAQDISHLLFVLAHEQPLLAAFALKDGPDAAATKAIPQVSSFIRAQADVGPFPGRMGQQAPDFMPLTADNLVVLAGFSPLSERIDDLGLVQINDRRNRNITVVFEVLIGQTATQSGVAPIPIIHRHCLERHPMSLNPLNQVAGQFRLGLELTPCRKPDFLTASRLFGGKPAFREEQLAIDPQVHGRRDQAGKHPHRTQLDLAQAPVVLSAGPGTLDARFFLGALIRSPPSHLPIGMVALAMRLRPKTDPVVQHEIPPSKR